MQPKEVKLSRYDTVDYLQIEEDIAVYLEATAEESDPALDSGCALVCYPFIRKKLTHKMNTEAGYRYCENTVPRTGTGEEHMSTTHVTPAGGNIFADLSVPDAENEKLRLVLLASIREWFKESGMTQQGAADSMGIKQPVLNDALNGRFQKFTIDRLVRMLATVGLHVNITITTGQAA